MGAGHDAVRQGRAGAMPEALLLLLLPVMNQRAPQRIL
jgi:hypothetical protein